MKRLRLASVATITACLSLTGCAGGGSDNAGAATCEGQSVKIASTSPSFNYLPLFVADGAGLFEAKGLDVERVDISTGSSVVSALVGRSVDLTLSTFAEVLIARQHGAPVVALGVIQDRWASNVVLKKDIMAEKGITTDSPPEAKLEALRGLTMGVTGPGSGTDQVLRYLAISGGLDPQTDLDIIASGGASNTIAGFVSDRFDGFALSSPGSDLGVAQGDGEYLFNIARGDYEPLNDLAHITVQGLESSMDERPAVYECFKDALQEGIDMIRTEPERALDAATELREFVNDDEIYRTGFENAQYSYPETIEITVAEAQKSLDILNVLQPDEPVGEQTMQEVLDNGVEQSQ